MEEELRKLVAMWRERAATERSYDDYLDGKDAGADKCAGELEAVLLKYAAVK